MLLESDAGTCLHPASKLKLRTQFILSRTLRSTANMLQSAGQAFCIQRSWNTFDGRSSDDLFEVFLNIPRTIKRNVLKLITCLERSPELMHCVELG